ncbi:hypothetical protein [Mangrovivirga cuniculi]|uniref:Lipocalin-like domain-containing protein n=1 Tax=Mangrovivirga cuniculi TaxID=2715131 RepID=A0A4D7JQF2_9BACT|nr:hypothetical protein [Mangrovivirga cuniculi]QCK16887.1 hypothetical protein DCC35_20195 [Mangrovivirga cuniculi]
MKFKLTFLLIVFSAAILSAQNSELIGLWEVNKVSVGDRDMTPIAKWSRINGDGTYQTGNGWLQNGAGLWSFNKEVSQLSFKDYYNPIDPFGPFAVEIKDDEMVWSRMEEDMKVKVYLTRIKDLPRSHADALIGRWKATGENEESENMFLRWDRVYVKRSDNGNKTGYWIPHAHRAEVGFVSHDQSEPHKYYEIKINNDELTLTGVSDEVKGDVLTYIRIK